MRKRSFYFLKCLFISVIFLIFAGILLPISFLLGPVFIATIFRIAEALGLL